MLAKEFSWKDPAVIEHLKDCLKSGASRSMIAEKFARHYNRPFTKGSISGAVDRLEIIRRREKQVKLKKVGKDQHKVVRITKKKISSIKATSMLKLEVHHNDRCKWIDGDPLGAFSVCGQPAALKSDGNAKPYCPHHCSIAYVTTRERQKEEANG